MGKGKSLPIIASLTIAEHLLPGWVAHWRTHIGDGGPVVELSAANSRAVIEAVREGTVDLGFIETPTIPPDVGSVIVGSDQIQVVASINHPWAARGRISMRELSRTPLVLRETGSGTRQALKNALAQEGFPVQDEPAAVISTTLGVRSAIMAGVGPGALSSLAVADDIRSGRLARINVTGLEIKRPLAAIWPDQTPSSGARSFLDAIFHLASQANQA